MLASGLVRGAGALLIALEILLPVVPDAAASPVIAQAVGTWTLDQLEGPGSTI